MPAGQPPVPAGPPTKHRVGGFIPVTVRSIECKRQAVREARAGGAATFALRSLNRRVWRAPARGARDARARADERG